MSKRKSVEFDRMSPYFSGLIVIVNFFLLISSSLAQDLNVTRYDVGSPTLTELWVDPVNGSDSNSGNTRNAAYRTISAAWARVPQAITLSTTGYRINLVAGDYPEASIPNFWEERFGTREFPIILQAIDGRGTANLLGDINALGLRYFYMIDIDILPSPAGDALHCELCDHILMRGMELSGGNREAQETIKFNQSQYIYLEDSVVHGASDNTIDYVAVQYGHIIGNEIHDAQDWCLYVKGGSAYMLIERNLIYNCGTGGFTAGQGTGFEFMSSPWLHYEAYDVKFINNIVRDTEGAGMGVNGGYNILLAHNTLYRIGSRSHLLEVVYGLRTCDGNPGACTTYLNSGGWGTGSVGPELPVGNRNVFIFNNLFYNPSDYQSAGQHFSVQGPRTIPPGTSGPDPAVTDTNLSIRGNIVFNGSSSTPLGIEDNAQGCRDSNSSCNETQLRTDNSIHQFEPQLIAPISGDFRPVVGGNVFSASTFAIPAFAGGDREATPLAPQGTLINLVTRDYTAATRASTSPPGAFAGPLRSRAPADAYLPWNGFLSMNNVLELVNAGSSSATVTITLFDISGNAAGQLSVNVPAEGQLDVLINLFSGFSTSSYGLITLDFDSVDLSSRMSFYRPASDSPEFDFAYTIPGNRGLQANSFVNFNTFQPSRAALDQGRAVNNFLSIVNYDGNSSHTFQVLRFDAGGTLLRTDSVVVAPFARQDIEAGHTTPGPNNIGLLQIIPDTNTFDYSAFLIRYGERTSSTAAEAYAFAFPLIASSPPAGTSQVVPISTGGEAQNWVEVSNVSDSSMLAQITFYNQTGTAVTTIAQSIPAFAQSHINANQFIPLGSVGHVEVISSMPQSLNTQSMFYFFSPTDSISSMYGTQAKGPLQSLQAGSYNLFLGMFNFLKIFNPSDVAVTGSLFVHTATGVREFPYALNARSATDLALHEGASFGTTADTYGLIRLNGSPVFAEILRIRPSVTTGFDYAFPTPLD